MLQIHQLRQLTPKAAELESIYIVRRLREKGSFPLTEQQLQEETAEFFISPTDIETIEQAHHLIAPTLEKLRQLLQEKNPLHEPLNIRRAISILQEIPRPLQQNIQELRRQMEFLPLGTRSLVSVLNRLPPGTAAAEKQKLNQRLNELFLKLLRTDTFSFRSDDIIHEAPLSHAVGLKESMEKGFLFHSTLEEELKRLPFSVIQRRLPYEKIVEAAWLAENISVVSKGVERAYEINMRLVNLAVVWYAYVKWVAGR